MLTTACRSHAAGNCLSLEEQQVAEEPHASELHLTFILASFCQTCRSVIPVLAVVALIELCSHQQESHRLGLTAPERKTRLESEICN